jgi:hypothetical protein
VSELLHHRESPPTPYPKVVFVFSLSPQSFLFLFVSGPLISVVDDACAAARSFFEIKFPNDKTHTRTLKPNKQKSSFSLCVCVGFIQISVDEKQKEKTGVVRDFWIFQNSTILGGRIRRLEAMLLAAGNNNKVGDNNNFIIISV